MTTKHAKKDGKRHVKHIAAALTGAAILSSALAAAPAAPVANASPAADPSTAAPQIEQTASINPAEHVSKANNEAPAEYKEVLQIKATAYAPGWHDNQQYGNKTHLGTQIRPGVIAVDPSIIPLGSRVYIQFKDGHGQYAVAEDTGGAIKGNRIDIAKWTVKEAEDFGIQHVRVYVLEHGTRHA